MISLATTISTNIPDADSSADPTPLLSIGMPVYNGELFIQEALDSLLSQSVTDFELIISDNGSTDRTAEIYREYAEQDERIRFVREEENRGYVWNFNRVVELSCGKYFKWAAADDIHQPDFLERCIAVLENDPSVVCCHTYTNKIDSTGAKIATLTDPTEGGLSQDELQRGIRRPDASSPSVSQRFHDVLCSPGWGARISGVMRRDELLSTGLLKPYYGSEKVLMGDLALKGRFYDVPEFLFSQRVHVGASACLDSGAEQEQLVAPQQSQTRWSGRLRLLQGHIEAVRQNRLSWSDRWRCWFGIVSYLSQFHKWHRVIIDVLRGRGIANKGSDVVAASIVKLDTTESSTCDYRELQVAS